MSIDKLCDWGERVRPTMPCFQGRRVCSKEMLGDAQENLRRLLPQQVFCEGRLPEVLV